MKILSLNGIYDMCSSAGAYACRAVIPGSDMGNLIKNGVVPDLLNEPNGESLAEEIASEDFVFSRAFFVGEELAEHERAVLCFEKLDTLCTVYLNGTPVLSAANAHISYRVDVKEQLKTGENELRLCFDSPLIYVRNRQKMRAMPQNVNGENGAQYLRKANCSFGWDWGPSLPYNYCGDVQLRFFDREITDIKITQKTDEVVSVVSVSAENAEEYRLISPGGESIEGENGTFIIKYPELWYPRDLSDKERQPLYTLVLKNKEMTVEKKIGLRRIELDTSPDIWGSNFAFVVNGKRVFAKGANVVPFAALPEYAREEDIDFYAELAAKSNFNMLRVWGGGEYASEHFLSRCDELGILVWQDLCFACMMYPLDDGEFLANVKREAEENVKRLSCHSCLALLCGNNEIEAMNAVLPGLHSLKKAYTSFFYEELPLLISPLTDVPYIPTSPLGKAPFTGNGDENNGDSHMWSVWHGLMPTEHYATRYARFLSEFGMESLPSMKAVNKFSPGETSLYSPVFLSRQKCREGNRKIMYYLGEKYGGTAEFDTLPYLTGIMQADCIRAAAEHFRRNKGRCNGALFWQLNDVWNAPSWSAVDFEKVPKALMYKAREFFAPLTLSYDGKTLYLHNDTVYDRGVQLFFEIKNGKRLKRTFAYSVVSKADTVVRLGDFELEENDIMSVKMNERRFVFDNVKKLPEVNISVTREKNALILCADAYARNVCIESDALPDDNYFTLLPGEKKTVHFTGLPETYRVLCENSVRRGTGWKDGLFRFTYRLAPGNAASYFWHKFH